MKLPMLQSKLHWVLLAVIVVLAFGLRVYRVTDIPPSLNWDEVSIGYNAYSILKTGHDEWGEFLPLHFKSYGEYKLPVQIYGSIPAIALLGLNDFSVRITPVIYGTLTILATYFLVMALFGEVSVALLASFLLAISPWHLQLTRGSFEASFACFWIVLAMNFLVRGFKKSQWWILSAVFFAIAIYTYNSARGFVPLFLSVAGLIYWKDLIKKWKVVAIAGVVFVGLLLPLVPFVISGDAKARYKLVSITDDPGLLPRINEHRGQSTLPQPLPRLVHNKVTYVSLYFIENYLAHFTPDFLFISGAPHKQHHVQGMGELYAIEAPFLLLGLWWLIVKKYRFRWLLLSWILLTYVPVAATHDSIPHALRTVIVLPTYQLITALGFINVYKWMKKKRKLLFGPFIGFSAAVLLICIGYYFYLYYQMYPVSYSKDWQYGYKQVVEYIKEHQSEYDLVVFSRTYGEPHMFTMFYQSYDPYAFQHDPHLIRFETNDWVRVLKFSNYYFPDLGDEGTHYADVLKSYPHQKLLFIGKAGDFPQDAHFLQTVYFLNGDIAFQIATNQ